MIGLALAQNIYSFALSVLLRAFCFECFASSVSLRAFRFECFASSVLLRVFCFERFLSSVLLRAFRFECFASSVSLRVFRFECFASSVSLRVFCFERFASSVLLRAFRFERFASSVLLRAFRFERFASSVLLHESKRRPNAIVNSDHGAKSSHTCAKNHDERPKRLWIRILPLLHIFAEILLLALGTSEEGENIMPEIAVKACILALPFLESLEAIAVHFVQDDADLIQFLHDFRNDPSQCLLTLTQALVG